MTVLDMIRFRQLCKYHTLPSPLASKLQSIPCTWEELT
jgi:hypothetical protein